jgi:transcriptional regulator with XRE-family HTH domain
MQELVPGKLRLARIERGFTLRQAAKLTGVTKETLSDLERGLRQPHPPTLFKIAQGYGIPVKDLLEEPVLVSGKDEAPQESVQTDQEVPILHIVHGVVLHQRLQDRQAQARAEEGEAILRKRHPDDLAQACIHLEHSRLELLEKLRAKNEEIAQLHQRLDE